MLFTTRPEKSQSKFDKVEFLRFDPGVHVVRILGEVKSFYSHFLPKATVSVRCLEDDCPICAFNKRLIVENPDNFRSIPGWNARQFRHYFNVLDRTNVKVCPQCGAEVKRGQNSSYPATCSACNTVIPASVPETPSNKIKLASISDTNATLINTQLSGILDKDGNPAGVNDYDLMFTVVKIDGKKNIMPAVSPNKGDLPEVKAEDLYDPNRAVIELNSKEILEVLRGVTIRDIFAARRVPEAGEESPVDTTTATQVANLFGEPF